MGRPKEPPHERLLRDVRTRRPMGPDDGRRNRGPHTPERVEAMRRGQARATWVRHQRDLAFDGQPHVAVPTEVWLRNPPPARQRHLWPDVACVPCWQRAGPSITGATGADPVDHLPGGPPDG